MGESEKPIIMVLRQLEDTQQIRRELGRILASIRAILEYPPSPYSRDFETKVKQIRAVLGLEPEPKFESDGEA